MIAGAFSICLILGTLAGCDNGQTNDAFTSVMADGSENTGADVSMNSVSEDSVYNVEKGTIYIYSSSDEVPAIIQDYVENNEDFKYNIEVVVNTGAYEDSIDSSLSEGNDASADIYVIDATDIYKYTKGDMAQFAAPYSAFGIEVQDELSEAGIAQYTIDMGTNSEGDIVALCYESTAGCMVYRRSIAIDVFGSDDPEVIEAKIGAGTGRWDDFWSAAYEVRSKGYKIVSGPEDLWNVAEKSASQSWINADGKLEIDPEREEFIDINKKLLDGNYSNNTAFMKDDWYDGMSGTGEVPVFAYFGPSWLVSYTLNDNCGGTNVGEGTYGDWAVCQAPVDFYWGGSYILASRKAALDPEKASAIGELLRYITLNTSEDGLQYNLANGTLHDNDCKIAVASNTVMSVANGEMSILAGQNAFDVYSIVVNNVNGNSVSQHDKEINELWLEQCTLYANGEKARGEAIADFKSNVYEQLGIEAK